jgi:hypothetical protein
VSGKGLLAQGGREGGREGREGQPEEAGESFEEKKRERLRGFAGSTSCPERSVLISTRGRCILTAVNMNIDEFYLTVPRPKLLPLCMIPTPK